ncbi:hypothetical protein IQ270_01855 [Microcoleus sp. LEGE 07076]|uniref:hypothetical protein n=1 Tax=Microcoleus sp. LEGE 07076 TaxID=915322 RepID=UPI00187DECAD|nr:hypothetical protein [Microcoleus sp. LEGE 07076]MBE9183504.1 hypothetical protein [Microcoleus sp. LEGE 07076]
MNQKINIIGICPETLLFQSIYVPLISFQNEEQKKAAEDYITGEAKKFFDILLPDQEVKPLAYPMLITELDFQKIDMRYFYENLFYDLERKPDGKLEAKIKWGITFDEKCAPINLGYLSPKYDGYEPKIKYTSSDGRPYRRYGTIDINGKPVFYYIYFTLQEILDEIKQLPNS